MVLRVDPEEKQAYVLSFPRDLYLPISGTGETQRINTAHAHGVQTLIDTIQDNFDIPINHYVEIDFVGFEKLVDAVGGVPLWFDAPVRDRHTGLDVPQAECQVLDGEQARKFVRSRYLEYQDEDGEWHSRPHRRPRPHHPAAGVRAPGDRQGRGAGPHATRSPSTSSCRRASPTSASTSSSTPATCSASARRSRSSTPTTSSGYSIPSEPMTTSAGAQVRAAR